MTIRFKIFMLAVVMLLLLLLSVVVSTYLQVQTTDEVGAIAEYHVLITSKVSEIDVLTFEYELNLLRMLSGVIEGNEHLRVATEREGDIAARLQQNFSQARELIQSAVDDPRNDLSDRLIFSKLDAKLTYLERELAPFLELGKKVLTAEREGRREEAGKLALGFNSFEEAFGPDLAEVREDLASLTQASVTETFQNQEQMTRFGVVQMLLAGVFGLAISAVVANRLVRSLRRLLSATRAVEAGDLSIELPPEGRDEAAQLTEAFNRMTERLRSVSRIKETFGQYVDPRIVEQFIDTKAGAAEVAERRVVTVFFSDVQSFTSIGEQLTAARLAKLLNHYFTYAAEAIRDHNGIIDKYIGDAVMAFWTTPFSPGDHHAADACQAALDQQKALLEFRRELPEILGLRRNVPDFRIRMGLATGEVLLGTLGSPTAKSFTVIGDVVNLASRLENLNKLYGTPIIASEETVRLAKEEIETRELDRVTVAGKSEAIRVFEVLAEAGRLDSQTKELVQAYQLALTAYREGRWEEAARAFQRCLEIRPEDGPSHLLLARIQDFRSHPPAGDWDGTWHLTAK